MQNQSYFQYALLVGALVASSGSALAAEVAKAAEAKPADAKPAEAEAEAAPKGPKVLVLPYQPIFRSVAQKKVATATDLLTKELGQKGTIVVIRGAVSSGDNADAGPSLDGALAAIKTAEEAEAKRDISAAIAARTEAIKLMEKNAAAIEKPDDYTLAHHYLARALMWAARDAETKRTIVEAARMNPNLQLPVEDFSRLYRAWLRAAATNVMKEKRGELFVKSGLPGAKIFLDGREMDVAPVVLQKAVPGKHLLIAKVAGVPPFGGVVEVKPGKKTTFTVSFGGSVGGDSVGDVADAIATNAIPANAVKSAVTAGKAAGAKFVVAGGLAKDDDHFNVHTFVVDVDKGSVTKLDVVNFDLELLTAEADVLQIVNGINGSVAKFENGASSLKTLDGRIRSQSTINEVDASPAALARRPSKKGRKNDKRVIFKPLKGGSIIIKDEEE